MARRGGSSGLLTRLMRPLRRLLSGPKRPVAAPTAKNAAEERLADESFRLAIETMAKDQTGRFQTKLQIISLIEFREAVGDKWGRLSDKVMMIAEGVIKQHLGEGNSSNRQGQDFFVLMFRSCSQAEGRRRALVIAQELGTRLLGDQFIGMSVPLALAAEVTLADVLNPDNSLNLALIQAAVGEMRSLLADVAPAGAPPPSPIASDAQRPAKETAPPLVAPFEPVARAATEPGWQKLDVARPKRGSEDPAWTVMERPTTFVPRPIVATPPLPPGAILSLLWRPTWVADGEAIAAYKAQIQRADGAAEAPLEGACAYPAGGGASALTLDRHAAAGATRELAAGDGAALIVPLHWASVSSAQRGLVVGPFADISEAVRARRLVIDLFGVPADVSPRELTDTLRALRPVCRQVALRVRLGAPKAGLAVDCGAAMIGIDLAELALDERTDDQHLIAALARFQQAADQARIGAYVWGVRRRNVVARAVQAGFAMVNGAALMKDLGRPAKVLPAPKARFGATA